MLKYNRVKRSREEKKRPGKIIDFTLGTVLVLVGCEKVGVIDTLVSCSKVTSKLSDFYHLIMLSWLVEAQIAHLLSACNFPFSLLVPSLFSVSFS